MWNPDAKASTTSDPEHLNHLQRCDRCDRGSYPAIFGPWNKKFKFYFSYQIYVTPKSLKVAMGWAGSQVKNTFKIRFKPINVLIAYYPYLRGVFGCLYYYLFHTSGVFKKVPSLKLT